MPGRHRQQTTPFRGGLAATALAAIAAVPPALAGASAAAAHPEPAPGEPGPTPSRRARTGTCQASYYDGRTPGGLTAAHRTLPIGSKVRVTNPANDRSVLVRIDDRGPFVVGRCLDLSEAAMRAIGGVGAGVIPVRYEVLA